MFLTGFLGLVHFKKACNPAGWEMDFVEGLLIANFSSDTKLWVQDFNVRVFKTTAATGNKE